MSRLKKVIAIKLAGQPEHLAGLSDLGSNLPHLTTWVSRVLLSHESINSSLGEGKVYSCTRHHFIVLFSAFIAIKTLIFENCTDLWSTE